jgi:hypothetical protein
MAAKIAPGPVDGLCAACARGMTAFVGAFVGAAQRGHRLPTGSGPSVVGTPETRGDPMERQDHPTGTGRPTGTVPPGEQPEYQQAGYGTHPWTTPPPQAAAGGTPPWDPRYGAAPAEPERPTWSTRRTGVVTAIAAAAVLAVGGVAIAHSGDGSSTTQQGPGGQGGPGGGFGNGGPGGQGGFPGGGATGTGLAGALHGTFVTRSDGAYVTRVMQTGSVTAAGSTSITVRSADGYTKSYTLSSSTSVNGGQAQASSIATGNTVTVVATEAGAATSVLDQSLLSQSGTGPQGAGPGGTS